MGNSIAKHRGPASAKNVKRIREFLCDAPSTVERLSMAALGMPETVLCELTHEDFGGADPDDLAERLADRADDYAENLDRETRFSLVFWREGTAVLTLSFRAGVNWQGGGVGTAFDGTAADVIGQMQRHLEAQTKTMLGAMTTVLQGTTHVIEQQRLEIADLRASHERVQEREEAMRIAELESLVEELQGGDAERVMKLGEVAMKIAGALRGDAMPSTKSDDTTKH